MVGILGSIGTRKVKPGRTQQRYFKAAKRDRLTADWLTQSKTIDEVIAESLENLRARSREQRANNDYLRRFIQLTRSNVIGPKGIAYKPVALDRDGKPDKQDNAALEAAWREWGKKTNCDISRRNSWLDIEKLAITSTVTDGEFIARMVRRGDYGLQLQVMDPIMLPVGHNVDLKNGNYIRFSIEYDKYDAPVAYYFKSSRNGEYQNGGQGYTIVPVAEVIHTFITEHVGQRRGLPWGSTALLRMKMLDGFEDAAVTRARVGASAMGFFTRNSDGEGYTGDAVEESTGAMITDMEPGIFEELPDGVGFESFDPSYPDAAYEAFVGSSLRGVAAGLGVSYYNLANDLSGVNYTSSRTGALEDREEWKSIQEWLIEELHQQVFDIWLPSALAMGMIVGPTGVALPMSQVRKFKAARWKGRRWAWVDPPKRHDGQGYANR